MPTGFFPGVFYVLTHHWAILLSGVLTTLLISLLGTLFGFLIGLLLAAIRVSAANKPQNKKPRFLVKMGDVLARIYIQVFRGTPMIVQATVIYYGVLALFGYWSALVAGIVVVSLNTAAYMAEIIRGAIGSIDKGQTEAGLALGMNFRQILRHIILPQALRHAIPAFGNELIVNIKDTAVLSVIAVSDLFYSSKFIITNNFRPFEVYFIVSLVYLSLTLISSSILKRIEHGLHLKPAVSPPMSQTVNEVMGAYQDE